MWIKICGPEAKKASPGGCKDQRSISHSPRSVTPFGQIQLGGKRSSTESVVLQSNTKRPGKSSGEEQSELQCSMPTIPSIQRGVRLVDTPASTLEWEESGNDTARPPYRIRCLPHRVGSVLRGDIHGRPVVHKGTLRRKSSQSYDSLCKKWISWCPVSGPIEDVVNFLAFLHGEGYQYTSLNSYRSAIASMHAPFEVLTK